MLGIERKCKWMKWMKNESLLRATFVLFDYVSRWKTFKATSTLGISSGRNSKPTSAAQAGWLVRLAAPATMSTKFSIDLRSMPI